MVTEANTNHTESQAATVTDNAPYTVLESRSRGDILHEIATEQMRDDHPDFRPGDFIEVKVKVTEGSRTRLQLFSGVVIAIRNRGLHSSFIVRKQSGAEGVERTFITHSRVIDSITIKRRGDVRRAKLFYLRGLSGKAARIKEKLPAKKTA